MRSQAAALEPPAHPRQPTVEPPVLERLPAQPDDRIDWIGSLRYLAVHVAAGVGALVWLPSWGDIALCAALYYGRLLGITLGYHRYFAHRTFRTSRVFQFLLAFWAQTSLQRGVLWWAGNHRLHHRYADQPEDLHSPARRGFLWSHTGWIMAGRFMETPFHTIPDMARYPELRWLNRNWAAPAVLLAVGLWAAGGAHALVWGFLVSTVLLWHGTYTINSLAHVYGSRRFPTTDTSRNNLWLALLAAGEGWHNNHHYYSPSARLGFRWWEVDPGWYLLWLFEKLGLVWEVRRPPARVTEAASRPSAVANPASAD